jgi:8-oxo-dGTP diphosphatase
VSDPKPYFKVAAHGLIQKDGKFLVTHRATINDYMPELWDLPGGTVEFEENIYQCLEREVDEETKLKVEINQPLFVYDYLSDKFRHQFTLVYHCNYQSGEVVLNPEEHDDFKWATLGEMEQLPKIAFLEELFNFLKK